MFAAYNPNEQEICETAAKLAQRYMEAGAYHGGGVIYSYDEETAAFEIAEWYMNRMGLMTFGVVSCDCDGTEESIRYVNVGESYTVTVVLDGQEFSASSWGSWYEETETEYCKENDVIRCGYCSHLTPFVYGSDGDWRDTVCESCGHYVGGGGKPEPVALEDDDES